MPARRKVWRDSGNSLVRPGLNETRGERSLRGSGQQACGSLHGLVRSWPILRARGKAGRNRPIPGLAPARNVRAGILRQKTTLAGNGWQRPGIAGDSTSEPASASELLTSPCLVTGGGLVSTASLLGGCTGHAFCPQSEEAGMSYRKDGFLVPAGGRTTAGWFMVTVLFALLAWTTGALAQLTWDPAAEFSPVNNPNGPWTYGQANTLGASISLLGNLDHCGGVVDIWNMAPGASPSVLHNGTGQTVHCSAGLDIPPGALALHPSNGGQYAVIRWTAPLDLPSLTIDATFLGLDANGTTTDVAILLNSSPQWSSWIGYNGHAYSPDYS